jgi:uncharacterized protein YjbI with pentapeptide repeats
MKITITIDDLINAAARDGKKPCRRGVARFLQLHGEVWEVEDWTYLDGIELAKRSPLWSGWLVKRGLVPKIDARGEDLRGYNFESRLGPYQRTFLTDATFDGADLTGANLSGVYVRNSSFANCIMTDVKTTGLTLFVKTDLTGIQADDKTRAAFSRIIFKHNESDHR